MKPLDILKKKLEQYPLDENHFDYRQIAGNFSQEELKILTVLDTKSINSASIEHVHFNSLFFLHHVKLRQFELIFKNFDFEKEKTISIFRKLSDYKKYMFPMINQYSFLKNHLTEKDGDIFFMTHLLQIFHLDYPSKLQYHFNHHLKEILKKDENTFYKKVENLIDFIFNDIKFFKIASEKILPDLLKIMPESKEKEILNSVINHSFIEKSALLINKNNIKTIDTNDFEMIIEIFTKNFEKQNIQQKKSEDTWENLLFFHQHQCMKIDLLITNSRQIYVILAQDMTKKFMECYEKFMEMIEKEEFKSPIHNLDILDVKTEEFFILQSMTLDDNNKKRPKL